MVNPDQEFIERNIKILLTSFQPDLEAEEFRDIPREISTRVVDQCTQFFNFPSPPMFFFA
jgi:hypothetical protein